MTLRRSAYKWWLAHATQIAVGTFLAYLVFLAIVTVVWIIPKLA